MSKQRTINTSAEYGADIKTRHDGAFVLEAVSRKHKIRVVFQDIQALQIIEGIKDHITERQRTINTIIESMKR